jgi:chromosome segregation ATPase
LTQERDDLENFGKEKFEGAELDLERMRGKYNKKND